MFSADIKNIRVTGNVAGKIWPESSIVVPFHVYRNTQKRSHGHILSSELTMTKCLHKSNEWSLTETQEIANIRLSSRI